MSCDLHVSLIRPPSKNSSGFYFGASFGSSVNIHVSLSWFKKKKKDNPINRCFVLLMTQVTPGVFTVDVIERSEQSGRTNGNILSARRDEYRSGK